jgi:hypothetical protein
MKLKFTIGVALLYLVFQAYLSLAAPGKIAPELLAGEGKADLLVTLPFPPERFHLLVFQRYGRVSGTRENSIELRGVAHENLRAVARPYWVSSVQPLGGDGS